MNPKQAAEFANLAYENETDGRKQASQWGFSFVLFTSGNHQAIVSGNDHQTVVAFRGTDSIGDWKTNLNSRQINNKAGRGKVHQGYHNGTWKLIPLFKHLLKGSVTFTGHSMGGAMAVQAGAILKTGTVYTFNAPKSGDTVFAEHYPTQVFRMVSKWDPAQSWPSDNPNWAHVGKKISLESTGHSMDRIVGVF